MSNYATTNTAEELEEVEDDLFGQADRGATGRLRRIAGQHTYGTAYGP